jgi:hypothetical protein
MVGIENLEKLHLKHTNMGNRKPQYLLYGQNHYNSIVYISETTFYENEDNDNDKESSGNNPSHNSNNDKHSNRNITNNNNKDSGSSHDKNKQRNHDEPETNQNRKIRKAPGTEVTKKQRQTKRKKNAKESDTDEESSEVEKQVPPRAGQSPSVPEPQSPVVPESQCPAVPEPQSQPLIENLAIRAGEVDSRDSGRVVTSASHSPNPSARTSTRKSTNHNQATNTAGYGNDTEVTKDNVISTTEIGQYRHTQSVHIHIKNKLTAQNDEGNWKRRPKCTDDRNTHRKDDAKRRKIDREENQKYKGE